MLVDSHCHLDRLDLTPYNNNLAAALAAAAAVRVEYFLCPGIGLANFATISAIAQKFANVVIALGLHPTEDLVHLPSVQALCELADDAKVVGIGETGLDYYYCVNDLVTQERQQQFFRTQIRVAKILQKPLIIHSRMASADILRILEEEDAAAVGGVFHCFTDDLAMAEAVLRLNFYVAFSGIITFKNAANLRDVAKQIPLERILVETDAPYLAPVPLRGKPNEPVYLPYIADCLAKLREMSLDDIATQTTANFFRLFKCDSNK